MCLNKAFSYFFFQVRILTDAVDDITTVDDFLAVSENHILEDVNECVAALQVCTHQSLYIGLNYLTLNLI